jgi:hypothetical protein
MVSQSEVEPMMMPTSGALLLRCNFDGMQRILGNNDAQVYRGLRGFGKS